MFYFPGQVPQDIAQETADLSNHLIELTSETASRFAVAMASSENHFNETKDGLASAQFHFPGKTLVYYDIGLSQEQIKEVFNSSIHSNLAITFLLLFAGKYKLFMYSVQL